MKKVIGVVSTLLTVVVFAIVILGELTGGTIGLAYVISGSMEPTLRVGDGFILWPASQVHPGDVIMFRPLGLKATTVTHRIVGQVPEGFITRGDHNPGTDQAGGEPPVAPGRIVGRALTVGGTILRIPRLGSLSEWLRDLLKAHVWSLAGGLMGVSLLLAVFDRTKPIRQRPSRRRWRIGNVYRILSGVALSGLLLTMIAGSRAVPVKYMASTSPGTLPFHVRAGESGTVQAQVMNLGWFPVYSFGEAIPPAAVTSAPGTLGPRTKATMTISTPPRSPGWYQEYVREYRYPPLLPYIVVAYLHRASPLLAMSGILTVAACVLWFIGRCVSLWIPLEAMRDEKTPRLVRRMLSAPPSRRRI